MLRKILAIILAAALAIPTTAAPASAECSHSTLGTEITYDDYNAASGYHNMYRTCTNCGEEVLIGTEKHKMTWAKWSEGVKFDSDYWPTTLFWMQQCSKCQYIAFDTCLRCVDVYKNSTKIVIDFDDNLSKGDTLKVKIGTKTYQTTLKKNLSKVSLKIKKPKKNSKITIYINHQGKKITYDAGYVLSWKYPKKGMTMKQVGRYTSYGYPYKTVKKSGGYTYWYWREKDEYVLFKKGKVVRFSKSVHPPRQYRLIG